MRISDWSSDVCSSDLDRHLSTALDDIIEFVEGAQLRVGQIVKMHPLARPDRDVVDKKVRRRCGVAEVKEPHVDRPEAFVDGLERPKAFRTGFELELPGYGAGGGRREDRKSSLAGTGESGRVDTGGSRK